MEWDWEESRDVLRRQLAVKSTTSYQVMLLEIGVRPIEILAQQRVYIDTWQKLRICQIIDDHILLGMLDVTYKRITRAKFSHLVGWLTSKNGVKDGMWNIS